MTPRQEKMENVDENVFDETKRRGNDNNDVDEKIFDETKCDDNIGEKVFDETECQRNGKKVDENDVDETKDQ